MVINSLIILALLLGCLVVVRTSPIFRKILSLVVITSLLSLPLASITANSAFTSFEDAIFEVSFMINEGGTNDESFLKTEPEFSSPVELIPGEELLPHSGRPQPSAKPTIAVLSLREIISEIFIPPQIAS